MLASRYVSPPEIAPHSAGAAIDLTRCVGDGAELDLGTRVNASPLAALAQLSWRNRAAMSEQIHSSAMSPSAMR
jgi:D-alanyl-D-alanine dipeptidase